MSHAHRCNQQSTVSPMHALQCTSPNCDDCARPGLCTKCKTGFGAKGGRCVRCNLANCDLCHGNPNTCQQCADGHGLVKRGGKATCVKVWGGWGWESDGDAGDHGVKCRWASTGLPSLLTAAACCAPPVDPAHVTSTRPLPHRVPLHQCASRKCLQCNGSPAKCNICKARLAAVNGTCSSGGTLLVSSVHG